MFQAKTIRVYGESKCTVRFDYDRSKSRSLRFEVAGDLYVPYICIQYLDDTITEFVGGCGFLGFLVQYDM